MTEIPENLRFYIDYDAIARGIELNGEIVEITRELIITTGCDINGCGTTVWMQEVEQHKEPSPRVAVGLLAGKHRKNAPLLNDSPVREADIQAGTASKG